VLTLIELRDIGGFGNFRPLGAQGAVNIEVQQPSPPARPHRSRGDRCEDIKKVYFRQKKGNQHVDPLSASLSRAPPAASMARITALKPLVSGAFPAIGNALTCEGSPVGVQNIGFSNPDGVVRSAMSRY